MLETITQAMKMEFFQRGVEDIHQGISSETSFILKEKSYIDPNSRFTLGSGQGGGGRRPAAARPRVGV